MREDSVLQKQKGVELTSGKTLDFYQLGLERLDVTEEQIKQMGNLIHSLSNIKLNGLRPSKYPEKGVTNDHHRHLQGAIFAFGTEGFNREWKEHSASSMREMISIFSNDGRDFNKTMSKYSENQSQSAEDLKKIESVCVKIKKYYQFFTGTTHHQQAAITNGFRQLEDPNLENEKCLTVDSFKLVFKHFFVDMKKIIENLPNL